MYDPNAIMPPDVGVPPGPEGMPADPSMPPPDLLGADVPAGPMGVPITMWVPHDTGCACASEQAGVPVDDTSCAAIGGQTVIDDKGNEACWVPPADQAAAVPPGFSIKNSGV